MKILFIGLDYHGYTRNIIGEMRALGADVTYVDIQPRALLFKVLRTVGRGVYDRYLDFHHATAIDQSTSIIYDKVVFLQVHQMSVQNLIRLREVQQSAEFVLYNWDSLSNHDYQLHSKWFDRVLTFDPIDAKTHGYGYLPLFCSRFMQGLRRDRVKSGSIFMVGNVVKPGRYAAVQAFKRYCADNNIEFRCHLKVSPVVWIKFIRNGIFPIDLSFRSINSFVFNELIETSAVVFDFANHDQSGQTMRMMENLCLGKKIITSNFRVKNEPFYSPDRIYVFHGLDFAGVANFVNQGIFQRDREFPEYHIDSFVRQLLGLSPLLSRST